MYSITMEWNGTSKRPIVERIVGIDAEGYLKGERRNPIRQDGLAIWYLRDGIYEIQQSIADWPYYVIVRNDEPIRYDGNLGQEVLSNAKTLDEVVCRYGLHREVYGSPPTKCVGGDSPTPTTAQLEKTVDQEESPQISQN